MTNDNTPPLGNYIAERRKLRTWAKGKPRDVHWRVYIMCCQLRQAARFPWLTKIAASVIDCQIKQLRGRA